NSPPVPWDGPALDTPVTVAVTTFSGGFDIDPGIVELIERAAGQLADAGYKVVWADPPPITEPARAWFGAGSAEMEIFLDPAVQAYGSDAIKQVFQWFFDASRPLDRNGYALALADRNRMLRQWNLFLHDHPLVLAPFLMTPAYRWDFDLESFDAFNHWLDAAVWSFGINYLGLPAGVLGMDLVEGLPAGVQLIGRRWREDLICDALEAVETRNGVLTRQLWARE
ncbi:MAG: amidase family protein, partial [Acidimicrobiia bacterium]|nr:amidase family protein [Acidimicrobiia bacterium]